MTLYQRAQQFIERHGDAVAQARLHCLLTGTPSPEAVLRAFAAGQRADGGWPAHWSGTAASLDATCYKLAQLEALGATPYDPLPDRALTFLANRQQGDGAWQEEAALAGQAPAWAAPGDPAATLYVTANCAFWLVVWAEDASDAGSRAAAFLRGHVQSDGHLPSFRQAYWLTGALWYRLGDERGARRLLARLADGVDGLDSAETAWLLTALLLADVPANLPVVRQAVTRLTDLQHADGSWPAGDVQHSVHTTLEALRALLAYR